MKLVLGVFLRGVDRRGCCCCGLEVGNRLGLKAEIHYLGPFFIYRSSSLTFKWPQIGYFSLGMSNRDSKSVKE